MTTTLVAALSQIDALRATLATVANDPACPWDRAGISALSYMLTSLAGQWESELPPSAALALGLSRGTKWAQLLSLRTEGQPIPEALSRAAWIEAMGEDAAPARQEQVA